MCLFPDVVLSAFGFFSFVLQPSVLVFNCVCCKTLFFFEVISELKELNRRVDRRRLMLMNLRLYLAAGAIDFREERLFRECDGRK